MSWSISKTIHEGAFTFTINLDISYLGRWSNIFGEGVRIDRLNLQGCRGCQKAH